MKNISLEELKKDWQSFYRDLFETDLDYSTLRIPDHQTGFDRLIVVAPEMGLDRLYHKCRELFFGWKYTDRELAEFVRSDRSAKSGAYAVWFRDTIAADEDLKNLSAEDNKEKNIAGITLEERLLYELKYFQETGGHLDPDTFTLCTGSQYLDGYIPTVRYRVTCVGMGIHWYTTHDRFSTMRARHAI